MAAYVLLCEHNNFARAAAELGQPEAIVRERISSLESSLGAVLVEEKGSSVIPTSEGERYRKIATDVLHQVEALVSANGKSPSQR
ncbi:TPA: LysR family transcriptional regulator [Stenotrophomonas maltophilia]